MMGNLLSGDVEIRGNLKLPLGLTSDCVRISENVECGWCEEEENEEKESVRRRL